MMKYLVVLILALFALSSVNASTPTECELCEFVANYVDSYVKQNKTEAEIITQITKICTFVPEELSATCNSLVNVYADDLVKLVIAKESPAVICSQLIKCPAPSMKVEETGDLQCDICNFFVEQIEKYLAGNASQSQIIQFLDTDCKIFGKSGSATCQSLVQSYVPQLITLIENDENPATVCAQIQLCTSKFEVVEDVLSCSICTVLVGDVEQYVEKNQTEAQITAALEQECSLLPGKFFQSICDGIVADYADQIIKLVIADESATTICNQLQLCGSSSSAQPSGSSSEPSDSSSQSEASASQSDSLSGSSSFSGSATGSSLSGTSGSMKIYIQ